MEPERIRDAQVLEMLIEDRKSFSKDYFELVEVELEERKAFLVKTFDSFKFRFIWIAVDGVHWSGFEHGCEQPKRITLLAPTH